MKKRSIHGQELRTAGFRWRFEKFRDPLFRTPAVLLIQRTPGGTESGIVIYERMFPPLLFYLRRAFEELREEKTPT